MLIYFLAACLLQLHLVEALTVQGFSGDACKGELLWIGAYNQSSDGCVDVSKFPSPSSVHISDGAVGSRVWLFADSDCYVLHAAPRASDDDLCHMDVSGIETGSYLISYETTPPDLSFNPEIQAPTKEVEIYQPNKSQSLSLHSDFVEFPRVLHLGLKTLTTLAPIVLWATGCRKVFGGDAEAISTCVILAVTAITVLISTHLHLLSEDEFREHYNTLTRVIRTGYHFVTGQGPGAAGKRAFINSGNEKAMSMLAASGNFGPYVGMMERNTSNGLYETSPLYEYTDPTNAIWHVGSFFTDDGLLTHHMHPAIESKLQKRFSGHSYGNMIVTNGGGIDFEVCLQDTSTENIGSVQKDPKGSFDLLKKQLKCDFADGVMEKKLHEAHLFILEFIGDKAKPAYRTSMTFYHKTSEVVPSYMHNDGDRCHGFMPSFVNEDCIGF